MINYFYKTLTEGCNDSLQFGKERMYTPFNILSALSEGNRREGGVMRVVVRLITEIGSTPTKKREFVCEGDFLRDNEYKRL